MVKLYYLLLILISVSTTLPSMAQQAEMRIVSGIMNDDEGYPLPGVNIILKGTTTGTVSDINGRYLIKAPLGSTLVISSIGFTTYEVKVTTRNSKPLHSATTSTAVAEQPRAMLPVTKQYTFTDTSKGVARMGASSPTYIYKSTGTSTSHSYRYAANGSNAIYAIKYLPPNRATLRYGSIGKNGLYIIDDRAYWNRPAELSIGTSFTVDRVNRLPALQNTFAQGSPVNGTETWHGPEGREIFSWGPKIANLEYSNGNYAFDKNGQLVPRGMGNGRAAQAYDPYTFFRTGITTDNMVNIKKQLNNTYLQAGYQRRDQQLVLPGAGMYSNNLNAKFKTNLHRNLEADYALYLTQSESTLAQRGANLTGILSGVMLTPPTFDNSNGAGNKAYRNSDTYLLPDGSARSFSPGQSDNPYALSSQLPDREGLKSLLSNLHFTYHKNSITVQTGGSLDKQQSRSRFGLPALSAGSPEGRYSNRNLNHTAFNYKLNALHTWRKKNITLHTSAAYHFNYQEQSLFRKDGFRIGSTFNMEQADSIIPVNLSLQRHIHELSGSVKARYLNAIEATLSNGGYISSTLPAAQLLLPGLSVKLTLNQIDALQLYDILPLATVYASYNKTVREAPLLYNNWQYNSTLLPSAHYLNYTENRELHFKNGLLPETYHNREFGTELGISYYLNLKLNYYDNLTHNAIVPVVINNQFTLANSASIQTKGADASLTFSNQFYTGEGPLIWQSTLNLSSFRPVVTDVYNGKERIALAGFSDASTNLVAGQPYGVIYGSSYLRNADGQLVIGADGYPLIDEQVKPIGNPTPDWIGGFYNKVEFKGAWLAFTIDVKKGGDVWNGTSNVLNYYGTSQKSADLRDTRNYIFDGVLEGGAVNNKPVDFANPALGLAGNRWVRYGTTGVAEEAIEEASWIRMSHITLSYRINRLSRLLPRSETNLSFTIKNLFLITPYTGVDPSSTLFGYAAGTGLDLFNAPNTRSYTLSINIKL